MGRTSAARPIFALERDDVQGFAISKQDLSIELSRADDTWRIVGNDTLVVRGTRLDDLFQGISTGVADAGSTSDGSTGTSGGGSTATDEDDGALLRIEPAS